MDTQWLQNILPPIEKIPLRSEPDYYGISHLIAEKIGVPKPPRSFAYWMHGWPIDPNVTYPRELVSGGTRRDAVLVATQEQEAILKNFGYTQVTAAGMPFIYAESDPHVERQPNSLLDMPNHSSKFSKLSADQENYVREIVFLAKDFSSVVVSLHGSCVENNCWIPTLEKHGIPWIVGASINDKNALKRMNTIFKSFEYVTTNAMGSHILYASYLGCKTSFYGQFNNMSKADYSREPYYKKNPKILEKRTLFACKKNYEKLFPWLFVHPSQAVCNYPWAANLIGAVNKREASEIARLMGWSRQRQLMGYAGFVTKPLQNPSLIKNLVSRS
jgi:hypothetical protein